MKRYRIVQGVGYNGCIPITVYWVQERKDSLFSHKWENIKGFESYQRALCLLYALK